MAKIETFFKAFVLLSGMFSVVFGHICTIRFRDNAPLIIRSFGSRKVIQSNLTYIDFKYGEEIEAYCSTELDVQPDCCGLINKKGEGKFRSLVFRCDKDRLQFEEYESSYGIMSSVYLRCVGTSLQLYESKSSLPNCAYMSYGIGNHSSEETKRTGLCYDLDTFSIKYAKYLTYQINSNERPFKEHDHVISLDIELESLSTLFSLLSTAYSVSSRNIPNAKRIENILLNDQQFDYRSLIDDSGFFNYKDNKFEDVLNIFWWRNLREGNWNFFMNALKDRSNNVTYMAYTGVSKAFEISTNASPVKAPTYIYTYLQSLDPYVKDDVVVIGYNSPIIILHKKDEFCIDMCEQIDWLNKSIFGRTHLMSEFGWMTCCRVKDVFKKLENFPYTATTASPDFLQQ